MTTAQGSEAGSHHVATRAEFYRPDIDGLRGVAVLAVVGFHAFPGIVPGGFVGVDVFFVISGFLISSIIFSGIEAGRFSFRAFYARRIRRIFPALAIVLGACLAAGWFLLLAEPFAQLGKHAAGGAGFISNYLLWEEAGYFDEAAETKPLLHLWSLGIEEQFYLLWPLLVFLAHRPGANLLLVTSIVLAASIAANLEGIRRDLVGTFYSPVTRFWELSAGSVLAYASVATAASPIAGAARLLRARAIERTAIRDGLAAIGLALIVVAVFGLDRTRHYPGLWALLPVAGSFLLILAGPSALPNRWLLARRSIVWLGLISYPFYLWHWPLLTFARLIAGGTPPAALRLALLAVALLLSWATYALLERPIRFGPKRAGTVAVLCSVMFLAGGLGYLTYRASGFIRRPINLSDRAHFLTYYRSIGLNEMRWAYREECDFMEWGSERTKAMIDPSCTAPGLRQTVFLWGDSYAQALSWGLRSVTEPDTSVAQVTTSACRPAIGSIDHEVPPPRCANANTYAMRRIAELKPEVVILAERPAHDQTDWVTLARRIRQAGGGRVIVVGPTLEWRPSLPVIVTNRYWDRPYDSVSDGLDEAVFRIDNELKRRSSAAGPYIYVSLLDRLCEGGRCLAIVPGTSPPELLTFDHGHLTPRASVFVVQQALREVLAQQ